MPTGDKFHGKSGVLEVHYPKRIQYKDVTISTNDHYAYTDAATVPDADPETAVGGVEYTDANYQTVGVNNTSTVDKTTSTDAFYAMHYFKIASPAAAASVTRIEVIVHGTSNQGGALADGWALKIWDATNNTWDAGATTNNATETVLEYDITSSSTTTIAQALAYNDFLIFCAQAATASDVTSASNMNISFVEVKFWYARTMASTKGWSAKVEFDIDELPTQDSIFRADAVRSNVRIPVEISIAKFDGALMAEIMGSVDMDQDVDGSTSAGKSRGSIKDSSYALAVRFVGTITGTGGTVQKLRVDEVILNGFNFDAPENDWVVRNFTGIGKSAYVQFDT